MDNYPKNILVVDDDEAIRDLVALVLELEGYQVNIATEGNAALEHMATQGKPLPDLIVLDLMMPSGMDGLTFLKRLADLGIRDRFPIIVLTADLRGRQKAVQAGVDTFIGKPFDLADLLQKIADSLSPTSSP